MPDNDIALKFIRAANCPIAAPSANKFGKLSPVSAEHVKKQLPNVDCILDGGNTSVGIESTIVSIEGRVCRMLRPGVITLADIEKALPDAFIFNSEKPEKLIAPGLLKSHYSPVKPLYILDKQVFNFPESSGFIVHGKKDLIPTGSKIIHTSHNFNHLEIAANLFSALHAMEDDEHIKQIFIESVPEVGLGIAIMDRIKKAAYKYQHIS